MNKVLVITYYWPPGSGAGVQRWLKFSKYLPSFGWEPVILTVDPRYAAYPATDRTLENDIPGGIRVYKTPATDYFKLYRKDKMNIPSAGFASGDNDGIKGKILRFIRGNFFIPDPRRGWNKYAFRKACGIIENEKITHVITTSPPHSTQLIGLKLRKKFPHIKWIADLRDPWTDIYYYQMFYPTFISKLVDGWYERKVLNSCDKILTVGNSLKEAYSARMAGVREKTEVITNGYDEEDFQNTEIKPPEVFTISYIGTLSPDYPIKGFLSAFSSLISEGQNIKLRFVGIVSAGQRNQLIKVAGAGNIEFVPYVDHHEAIRYMQGSSALLLIIPGHHSNKSILTGKLFEYIAAGLPVICLGPSDGDAAGIIKTTCSGKTFSYGDSSLIREYILYIKNNKVPGSENIQQFSRKNLTEKLVKTITG
jgi:glycosyltransferase involved in cell wall biosynthesis